MLTNVNEYIYSVSNFYILNVFNYIREKKRKERSQMAIASLQCRLDTLVLMQANYEQQILVLSAREQQLSYKSEAILQNILSVDSDSESDVTEMQYEAQMQQLSIAENRLETERKNLETQLAKVNADQESVQSCLDKNAESAKDLFN